MNIFNSIRNRVRESLILKQLFAYYIVPSGLFDRWFLSIKPTPEWEERIALVLSSSDNDKIERVSDAGKIHKGYQTMHNGLKIALGSYYGPEVSHMLVQNRGVHEPQEEYVFQLVLDDLKAQHKKEYFMLELGSFWAFYSMWFKKDLPNTVNYMVEPDPFNIGCGKNNFKKNNFSGTFINAFVSDTKKTQDGSDFVSVDSVISDHFVDMFDIVHCDIQGFELDMLRGSMEAIKSRRIGYFFISTHSNELHTQCSKFLTDHDFEIIASANLDESFSFDGLIVARNKHYSGLSELTISLR